MNPFLEQFLSLQQNPEFLLILFEICIEGFSKFKFGLAGI
jgi:hypothetical protein